MATERLELNNVSVSYGAILAVNDVSFSVDGSSVCLLGANGAGKSSLLKAISGLVPYEGEILFAGRPLSQHRPAEIARLGLIHVPEGRGIIPTLNVVENVLLGEVARRGRTSRFDSTNVFDLFPELAAMKYRSGGALSGGEQQMLAIARALVAAPRLLLLDEPSLGLAPVVMKRVYEALAEIRESLPIVLVEQRYKEAMGLCDQAVLLSRGNLVAADATDSISDELVSAAYMDGS